MDFSIKTLGACKITSPILFSKVDGDFAANYVTEDEAVKLHILANR